MLLLNEIILICVSLVLVPLFLVFHRLQPDVKFIFVLILMTKLNQVILYTPEAPDTCFHKKSLAHRKIKNTE